MVSATVVCDDESSDSCGMSEKKSSISRPSVFISSALSSLLVS